MRALELFAGCGGAALGLRALGLDHVAAFELDPCAVSTLGAAGFNAEQADLQELKGSLVPKAEVWWASPPCQAWSQAGKRLGADDPRNGWPWVFRLLKEARFLPRVVITENVRGMLTHSKRACCSKGLDPKPLECAGCYFHEVVLPAFRELYPHVDHQVLNAADFGLPQRRGRVFTIASMAPVQWPSPTHSGIALAHAKWTTGTYWSERGLEPAGEPTRTERRLLGKQSDLLPWVTVFDALGLQGELGGMRNSEANPTQERPAPTHEPSPTVGRKGNQMYKFNAKHPPNDPHEPAHGIRSGGDGHSAPPVYVKEYRGHPASPEHEPAHAVKATDGGHYRVIGAGSNPHGPDAEGERTYRDITHEPSPVIAATQNEGNRGPYVEATDRLSMFRGREGGLREEPRSVHEPSVAIAGASGGSTRPKLVKAGHPELLHLPSAAVAATEVKGTNGKETTGWTASGGPSRASDTVWLGMGQRRLSVQECLVLQGFPVDYPLIGRTKRSLYRQVGNAVPPALATAVARVNLPPEKENPERPGSQMFLL